MKLVARKSRLNGTVQIPGSKSHTIRAVAIGSLAKGTSFIRNPLSASDTLSAVDCYSALGAKIDKSDSNCWNIDGVAGKIKPTGKIIDVVNSGTTLRLAIGSAALAQMGVTTAFTGDEQIQARPIAPLINSLNDLGAHCVSVNNNGKAPLRITGQIRGGRTTIEAVTSQYISSLLLCTPLAKKDTTIEVSLLNEPGYVQMTLDWLDKQNIEYENTQFSRFTVKGNQTYSPFDLPIPADFSSATFFLCAGALFADEIKLNGLDFSDSQPDKAVVDYLKIMGADINVSSEGVIVRASHLRGADIDMNATPDALPAMAVTAAFANGVTRLLNVPQARNKETDRIACMAQELKKMQVDVEELSDGLIIHPSQPLPAKLDGRSDHRLVMALSLAGLALDGQCEIDTAEAMSVTFPDFVDMMKSIGANMEVE